jgi:hypothetical protein
MKLKNLIYGLWTSCKIILHFCRQHHDTLSMTQGTYLKQPSGILSMMSLYKSKLGLPPMGGMPMDISSR